MLLKREHTLQAGIEFKKNLRERFGNYGGLKLEYFWVVNKGALSIGKGQIYLVLYEYYVGSYQANIS